MDIDLFVLAGLVALVATAIVAAARAANRYQQRVAFIRAYRFPPALMAKLRQRRPLETGQWERVLTQLRQYFLVCNGAKGRMAAMPSQVVDDAWHEFILFTRAYNDFCRQGLGRFLHHTPAEAMETPTRAQEGLRRTWRLACELEGIDPANPTRLPALFAMDSELGIEDGYHYRLDCLRSNGGETNTFCASHIGCDSQYELGSRECTSPPPMVQNARAWILPVECVR